jgi:class 3 adenylate cyclase
MQLTDKLKITAICFKAMDRVSIALLHNTCISKSLTNQKKVIRGFGRGTEKIKSTGTKYLIAIGLPDEIPSHCDSALKVCFSKSFLSTTSSQLAFHIQEELLPLIDQNLSFHIGINTGPVIAGIVGTVTQGFDIWGDTVNVSARMASLSESNSIMCTKVKNRIVWGVSHISCRR